MGSALKSQLGKNFQFNKACCEPLYSQQVVIGFEVSQSIVLDIHRIVSNQVVATVFQLSPFRFSIIRQSNSFTCSLVTIGGLGHAWYLICPYFARFCFSLQLYNSIPYPSSVAGRKHFHAVAASIFTSISSSTFAFNRTRHLEAGGRPSLRHWSWHRPISLSVSTHSQHYIFVYMSIATHSQQTSYYIQQTDAFLADGRPLLLLVYIKY